MVFRHCGLQEKDMRLQRADNQRGRVKMKVIEAVIKKAQSSALLNNYDEIFANISKSFQTNMPKKDINALVKYQHLMKHLNWKLFLQVLQEQENQM